MAELALCPRGHMTVSNDNKSNISFQRQQEKRKRQNQDVQQQPHLCANHPFSNTDFAVQGSGSSGSVLTCKHQIMFEEKSLCFAK